MCCLGPLWLARAIALVLVLRDSIQNRSISLSKTLIPFISGTSSYILNKAAIL